MPKTHEFFLRSRFVPNEKYGRICPASGLHFEKYTETLRTNTIRFDSADHEYPELLIMTGSVPLMYLYNP
jgi:hypothetical protein